MGSPQDVESSCEIGVMGSNGIDDRFRHGRYGSLVDDIIYSGHRFRKLRQVTDVYLLDRDVILKRLQILQLPGLKIIDYFNSGAVL